MVRRGEDGGGGTQLCVPLKRGGRMNGGEGGRLVGFGRHK